MKKIMLFLLAGLITISLWGQEKKDLTLSVATGKLTSPYYQKDKAGNFYSIDFDYYLTSRQIISANFIAGGHGYYDDVLSNNPGFMYGDGTNGSANSRIFSFLYKYKIVNTKIFSLAFGTGAGLMTQTRLYPYVERTSYYHRQSTWSDLVFPLRLELDYKVSKSFRLGFMGGFFIHPDYPILAYHAGPRITYVVK